MQPRSSQKGSSISSRASGAKLSTAVRSLSPPTAVSTASQRRVQNAVKEEDAFRLLAVPLIDRLTDWMTAESGEWKVKTLGFSSLCTHVDKGMLPKVVVGENHVHDGDEVVEEPGRHLLVLCRRRPFFRRCRMCGMIVPVGPVG